MRRNNELWPGAAGAELRHRLTKDLTSTQHRFFDRYGRPQLLVKNLPVDFGVERDAVLALTLCYSQAFVGDIDAATRTLKRIMDRTVALEDKRAFVVERLRTNKAFLELLHSGPDVVMNHLKEIEDQVAQAIGLKDLHRPVVSKKQC